MDGWHDTCPKRRGMTRVRLVPLPGRAERGCTRGSRSLCRFLKRRLERIIWHEVDLLCGLARCSIAAMRIQEIPEGIGLRRSCSHRVA